MNSGTAEHAVFTESVPETMVAARLHRMGDPLELDTVPTPVPLASDVLVKVVACGVVPNLKRVMANVFGTDMPDQKLYPTLPATFGLDAVGVVVAVGEQVTTIKPGTRVYVNPGRTCGACRRCRLGDTLNCPEFSFQGYFGRSRALMDRHPHGGLAQYITAPSSELVVLPDEVTFEQAARLGYLGTAYSAMKLALRGPGDVVMINGISGVLGICAALLALAMGARRVLGTGRNKDLLERIRQISPDRITVFSAADDGSSSNTPDAAYKEWVDANTDGMGVDAVIDCLPPGAPAGAAVRAIYSLRRGGSSANVGAVSEDITINPFWLVANRISQHGSVWFSTGEGEEVVALAASGALDLTRFDHRSFSLSRVNDALDELTKNRDGGFANYIINTSQL